MNGYVVLAVAGTLFASGVAADRFTPVIGANARIQHFKADRDKWKVAADSWKATSQGWEEAFRKSEHLRVEETAEARHAVNETALQCDARVKQARASAKAIREIVNRPAKVDATGCPVRGVIDASDLARALGAPR